MTKCIIIDDERPARELIELHLSGLKDFTLLASFENAVEAFNFIQTNVVDLIFLDIQMPKISGLALIKSLKTTPKIILTTAYREYAVEAFELDVLDYLVKPITQDRFMKAVSKFIYYKSSLIEKSQVIDNFNDAYIFLKTGKKQTKIYLNDILYIEGLKDYVRVHADTKVFVASERLSYMEQKLPENKFARTHKSFIVALHKITHYTAEQVFIGNASLPIGRVFKNEFLRKL